MRPMPPRQAAFRARLPDTHFASLCGLDACGADLWSGRRGDLGLRAPDHAPAWYEWLVIPAAFCLSNVFEWWIHKYVMHRPVKGLMGIYKRHTLAHHEFFTDVEPPSTTRRDFRIVFFPPYALVAFMTLSLVPAFHPEPAGTGPMRAGCC